MAKRTTIFMAEDDLTLGQIYLEIMHMHDVEVIWCQDGAEAREKLPTVTPDLIILDLHLPKVSGLELLSLIKSNSQYDHAKVIVLTADGVRSQQAAELADKVLLKPVSIHTINELVMSVLPA